MSGKINGDCRTCRWGPLKDCKMSGCRWEKEYNLQMIQRMDASEWGRFLDFLWKKWLLKPVDDEILEAIKGKLIF